jgi:hypothetical protein
MPAVKQPRRHHVERLKILVHQAEDLPQVREDGPGKLIDQKRSGGMQDCVGLSKNGFPQFRWHRGIGDARKHVICLAQV